MDLKAGKSFFRHHHANIEEPLFALRIRLPDRAFVPVRLEAVNVFAAEIELHRHEFADVCPEVFA